jgi:hypothetical protein
MATVKKVKKAQPGTSVSAKDKSRKQFVSDSTSVAKNYKTWSNPKSNKDQKYNAEMAIDEVYQRRSTKDFDKMGPAAKKVRELYSYAPPGYIQKNGGEVAKDGGKWIQKATASIKRRGTEGKCTPITKPGCTGRAKALAKTFKKIAKARKSK